MAAEIAPLFGELPSLHQAVHVVEENLAETADTHRRAAAQLVMVESDIKQAQEAKQRGDGEALDRHLASAHQRAIRARVGRELAANATDGLAGMLKTLRRLLKVGGR